MFQWAYNKRVDELLLSSEHIEETFHYLDRNATNQLDGVCVERVDSQPHKNVQNGNFSSNLWSVLKMAAHGRFNVQR